MIALPAAGVAAWTKSQPSDASGCAQRLDIAADPAIASAVVRAVAPLARRDDPQRCVVATVARRTPNEVAGEVARRANQVQADRLPDIWVPASSLWLASARATDLGQARVVGEPQSIASSPVVMAMPRAAAAKLGWPAAQVPVADLVDTEGARLAATDPRSDSAGLSLLLEVARGPKGASSAAATAGLANFARQVRVPLIGAGSPIESVGTSSVGAIPVLERDVVLAAKASTGPARTVGVYSGDRRPVADFPLVALASGGGGKLAPATERAVEQVRRALLSDAGQRAIRANGLRGVDGRLAAGTGGDQGVQPALVEVPPVPDDKAVRAALASWSTLGRRGRVLVAVDASGSMAGTLPGSRLTKSALAQRALAAVVGSIAPDSDMGLWTFTASRRQDYRILVPMGAADERIGGRTRRDALVSAVRQVTPEPRGGTGLYDTTLDAFRSATADYAYGRFNALLVITDGRNEDPGSLRLTKLLRQLRSGFDQAKPVRIITVAYGSAADVATLRKISAVTGGTTYVAPRAGDVGPLMARALGQL